MIVDAIVPAWNEALTIRGVLEPLVASRVFRKVLVVDDGSSDDTAKIARAAGAIVHRMPQNAGKGGAMLAGLGLCSDADAIAFFDADLIGLQPAHAVQLTAPILAGAADMTCGLRDYSGNKNDWQKALPIITGERCVRMPFLRMVPADFWNGFRIEAGINAVLKNHGGRVVCEVFRGVSIRSKWDKTGARQGIRDMAVMLIDVLEAMRDAERL